MLIHMIHVRQVSRSLQLLTQAASLHVSAQSFCAIAHGPGCTHLGVSPASKHMGRAPNTRVGLWNRATKNRIALWAYGKQCLLGSDFAFKRWIAMIHKLTTGKPSRVLTFRWRMLSFPQNTRQYTTISTWLLYFLHKMPRKMGSIVLNQTTSKISLQITGLSENSGYDMGI